MRAVSKKRAKVNRVYFPLRDAFLAAHPICQNCHAARSVDVDHIANRGQSAAALLDQSNWQALCRACHDGKGTNSVPSMPGWQYRQNVAAGLQGNTEQEHQK
jgi:5-methylcytosine-specific restriction endonuclease McrA